MHSTKFPKASSKDRSVPSPKAIEFLGWLPFVHIKITSSGPFSTSVTKSLVTVCKEAQGVSALNLAVFLVQSRAVALALRSCCFLSEVFGCCKLTSAAGSCFGPARSHAE